MCAVSLAFDDPRAIMPPRVRLSFAVVSGGGMRYFVILLCIFIWGVARAGERPIPQLDTGGHMATIRGVAFTPGGKQIVSAGDDKVVRVWDVESGKTIRTIRGESALGNVGEIFAMALSPDGKWLAVGGDLRTFNGPEHQGGEETQAIRFYDFESGKLVALLKGHTGVIRSLAFSPDGTKLISGSGDNTAIIWDARMGSGVQAPEPKLLHRLEGHKGDVWAVAFSPDGSRAVTGSYDKDLRLWQVSDGSQIAQMAGHDDKIMSLAFSPNGTIASGDISGAILLWDGRDGHLLRTLARQKIGAGSLRFSLDGKLLVATCGFGDCSGALGYVYDAASGQNVASYSGHDNAVYASAFSPDGRWVATGGGANNDIHLWDPHTGQRRLGLDGRPLRLGGQGQAIWSAGFSADGRQIGWGNQDACPEKRLCPNEQIILQQALTLPLGDATLGAPAALSERDANTFRHASPSFGGWSLAHREGGNYGFRNAILDILNAGQVVASITRDASNGLGHHTYSFAPGGETIISGGSFGVITVYDRAGKTLGTFVGHEGKVFAAVPSADGRYMVSGAGDETVRLWNLKTRELLVSIFQSKDGEWVMWTPQGYFAASPAGAGLIGWQINHGPEHEAEYVTAAQLRKSLNRPDIVVKAIQLASAEEAVKQSPGTKIKLGDLLEKPVPRFRIVSPATNATLTGGSAQLDLALEETPDPVSLIRLYVNGTQVDARQPEDGPGFKPGPLTFSVPLAKGRNLIRAVAVNETGEASAEVAVDNQSEGALDKRGTLRILAIGVDKYPGLGMACHELDGTPRSCDLSAAVSDATAFANAMAARLGPQHQHTVSIVLVNGGKSGEPTAGKIVDALDELRGAEPNDTVMLFVSGHGVHEDQDYYFVPTDAEIARGRLRKSTAVPWTQFQSVLEGTNGRRFLFLDTCRSGNRYSQRLTNDAYEQNIVIYAAARWDQDALERSDLGGGLFTYALVEGVKGAAKDKAGEVRAESLRDYVRARVRELAKPLGSEQEPQFVKGRDAQDYVLAR
jgi:WD40 repeat protein